MGCAHSNDEVARDGSVSGDASYRERLSGREPVDYVGGGFCDEDDVGEVGWGLEVTTIVPSEVGETFMCRFANKE